MIEAMTDGAVAVGIPRPVALNMSIQSMIGTCELVRKKSLLNSDHSTSTSISNKCVHPSDIRDSITTPGGCTMVGLLRLEDGGVRGHIARAIQSTTQFLNDRDALFSSK